MMRTRQESARDEDVAGAGRRVRAHGAAHATGRGSVHGRGGRRMVAPLAGIAFAAALVAGCGGAEQQETGEDPAVEEPAAEEDAETEDDAVEDDVETGDDTAEDDAETGDDTAEDGETGDDGSTGDDAPSEGENLFEGTWGFGHDSAVLSAEELSTLLEEEADARGPEEMTLGVECGDGIDSGAGDLDAECIAYADEGVEHLWLITAGPADGGLEIEVENAG
ncbi:hypothetical protein ACT3SP_00945 [Brachybacterium sp. AOP43-C2-M15]|uniref:hypothetical protein n=1 Tax=Brachybacterium sp. AOP43-C2-M15 TaxID=3457661 RepID=UPI0040333B3F